MTMGWYDYSCFGERGADRPLINSGGGRIDTVFFTAIPPPPGRVLAHARHSRNICCTSEWYQERLKGKDATELASKDEWKPEKGRPSNKNTMNQGPGWRKCQGCAGN